jgi:DNA-binding NarL/FixJ family response regulator
MIVYSINQKVPLGGKMENISKLILDRMPSGVIVFDKKIQTVYSNRMAANFLKRYFLPEEIPQLIRRIFEAMDASSLQTSFPGEVYLFKRLDGSSSNWIFRIFLSESPRQLVGVFIIEETVSQKLDMNEIRKQFRLTRREIDILRRVLDGMKNVEIAEELEISEQTVKDHLSNIYMKSGVENRFDLARLLMHTENSS